MKCVLHKAGYRKKVDRTEILVVAKGHVVDELCSMPNVGMELMSRAEYDRLLAVEKECKRVSALVRGICENAMKAVGSDSYEVQRLRAAVKQIAELMPAAIARAKGTT